MDRKSQQESPHLPDSFPVLRDCPLSGLGRLILPWTLSKKNLLPNPKLKSVRVSFAQMLACLV